MQRNIYRKYLRLNDPGQVHRISNKGPVKENFACWRYIDVDRPTGSTGHTQRRGTESSRSESGKPCDRVPNGGLP
jgi:hypothetical protein